MTPAKPGKTRKGAGRKVVFAVSKASPCSEPLGLQGKVYLGVCFPPPACGRMPTTSPQARRSGCFGGRGSRAKQEKLLLGGIALQKHKSPSPLIRLRQEQGRHQEPNPRGAEAGGAVGNRVCVLTSTRRCDLVFL